MACQANHAAAAANTARQAVTGTGVSRGSSIPAIATPIRTCSASASSSVFLPRSREMARRAAQQTAIMIMRTAKQPVSQAGALTSASPGPRVPGRPALRAAAGCGGRIAGRGPGPGDWWLRMTVKG